MISLSSLSVVKMLIALAGCALVLWWSQRPRAAKRPLARGLGALLSLLALAAYAQFFSLPHKGLYHPWELFHYYLGSKYYDELGYKGLYACAAQADAETGNEPNVRRRLMRNLATDELIAASSALDGPAHCKAGFSTERWVSFRSDVAWFRSDLGNEATWANMQRDHGYNPPPLWTAIGRSLASLSPPSERFLTCLASFDLALMATALAALYWAFGWRVTSVALIFWGTQAPSELAWTGGGFLRQDWLALVLLCAALLRKHWHFAAGAALSAAGLLRVFPLLLWAGPLVVIGVSWLRTKELRSVHARLLAGGATAGLVLALGSAALVGPRSYRAFADHIELRATSPIVNHMSLRTLFSASSAGRLAHTGDLAAQNPLSAWNTARSARLESMRPWYWLSAAALVGLFLLAVSRLRTLWVALGLSVILIPALTDPSCYYYSCWLVVLPLTRARRGLEMTLLGLAAAGQMLAHHLDWVDDRYVVLAALYVGFAAVLCSVFMRPFWATPILNTERNNASR